MLGHPTNFDNSRARALVSALAVGAGGVVCTFFLSSIIFLSSFTLSLGDGPI